MLNYKKLRCFKIGMSCLLLFFGGALSAQLTDDPSSLPVPDINQPDPDRAVVITVRFNTPTDVVLEDVIVAKTRARGSIGNPPLILVEILDHDGQLISEQNAWHPLWVRTWDEADVENLVVENSGVGTFFVPLSETLSTVRITDIELAQELITVDVSAEVLAYCESTPNTPICALFLSGFE